MRALRITVFPLALGLAPAIALTVSAAVAATTWCSEGLVAIDREAKSASVAIDWNAARSCTYGGTDGRIDERMSVTVSVDHFNFLHYGLRFDIERETIEAYAELADFWGRFLNLDILEQLAVRRAVPKRLGCSLLELLQSFDEGDPQLGAGSCLGAGWEDQSVRWRKLLRDAQLQLADHLRTHRTIALSDDGVRAIGDFRKAHYKAVKLLELFKRVALELAATNAQLDLFGHIEDRHGEIVSSYQLFDSRAALVEGGRQQTVRKQTPGTLVSVTMTASSLDGAAGAATAGKNQVVFRYFVHSMYPLLFHAGPAYSDGIDGSEFEALSRLSRDDLFAKIEGEEEDLDLSAFLSWQFMSFGSKRDMGLMLTFGTGFEDPGRKLFGGLSYRWGRWIVSGGWIRAEVEEGQGRVDGEAEPALFEAVRKGSDVGSFVSVSFKVFGIR